jgi:hypothetical protein
MFALLLDPAHAMISANKKHKSLLRYCYPGRLYLQTQPNSSDNIPREDLYMYYNSYYVLSMFFNKLEGLNQVPQCVRNVDVSEIHISFHNLDY